MLRGINKMGGCFLFCFVLFFMLVVLVFVGSLFFPFSMVTYICVGSLFSSIDLAICSVSSPLSFFVWARIRSLGLYIMMIMRPGRV